MPRAHIDLSPLFQFLAGNKTLTPNPDYYASPGQVPFDYAGNPQDLVGKGQPFMRPTLGEAYFNPQLMSDYNKFTYAPAAAAQSNALANQFLPDEIARQVAEMKARGATQEEIDALYNTARANRQAEGNRIVAEGANKTRQSQFGNEFGAVSPDLTSTFSSPQEAFALTGGSMANLRPTLTSMHDIRAGVPQNQASQQSLEAANAAREAGLYGTIGGPEAEAYRRDEANRLAAGQASAERTLTAPRTALTRATIGNEMFNQQNVVPPTQQRAAGLAQTGLNTLGLDQQTVEMLSRGNLFQATHGIPFGAVEKSPSIPTMGDTSVRYDKNPVYVPEALRDFRESQQILSEMKGGGIGAKIGASVGAPKKQAPSIPISGSPTTGRVTAAQVEGDFGNGKPWQLQAMQPTPDASRPLAGEGIVRPEAAQVPVKSGLETQFDKWISEDPSGVGTRQAKAHEALVEAVSGVIELPTEYVGSSNVKRSNKAVIADALADPARAAEMMSKLEALPIEVVQQIYTKVLTKLGAMPAQQNISVGRSSVTNMTPTPTSLDTNNPAIRELLNSYQKTGQGYREPVSDVSNILSNYYAHPTGSSNSYVTSAAPTESELAAMLGSALPARRPRIPAASEIIFPRGADQVLTNMLRNARQRR